MVKLSVKYKYFDPRFDNQNSRKRVEQNNQDIIGGAEWANKSYVEKNDHFVDTMEIFSGCFIFEFILNLSRIKPSIKVLDLRLSETQHIDYKSITVHCFDKTNNISVINVFPVAPIFDPFDEYTMDFPLNCARSAKNIDKKLKSIYNPDTISIVFINIESFLLDEQIMLIENVNNYLTNFGHNQGILFKSRLDESGSALGFRLVLPPESNPTFFNQFMQKMGYDTKSLRFFENIGDRV